MRSSLCSLCVAAVALCGIMVQAQAPIPYRPDGFQIGGPVSAPIVMDAFVDLLCPDSAAAWPNIKAVAEYYAVNISVAMHSFPLPYHNNAFMVAQAALTAVNAEPLNTGIYRQIADLMFGGAQQQFWNGVTEDQSFSAIRADLAKLMVGNNLVTQQAFDAGMADEETNNNVRVSWKFACSKGVLGTPYFFINGVLVNADPTWTLTQWRALLDPLLAPEPSFVATATAAAIPHQAHKEVHHKETQHKQAHHKETTHQSQQKPHHVTPRKLHHSAGHHDKRRHHDSQPKLTRHHDQSGEHEKKKSRHHEEKYRHHDKPTPRHHSRATDHKSRHHESVKKVTDDDHKGSVSHIKDTNKSSGCMVQRGHAGRLFTADATSCPVNEPACQYLPGKFECCYPGEICIPNVGCRC